MIKMKRFKPFYIFVGFILVNLGLKGNDQDLGLELFKDLVGKESYQQFKQDWLKEYKQAWKKNWDKRRKVVLKKSRDEAWKKKYQEKTWEKEYEGEGKVIMENYLLSSRDFLRRMEKVWKKRLERSLEAKAEKVETIELPKVYISMRLKALEVLLELQDPERLERLREYLIRNITEELKKSRAESKTVAQKPIDK